MPIPAPPPGRLRRWLREPLLHFLVLGAAMFGFSAWEAGRVGGDASTSVVVSARTVEYLGRQFAMTWQRPPDAQELKHLIDDHVRETIASREAMALGLDRDDTVIRRRLRQKLEFLMVEEAGAKAPTDDELRAWLQRHPDAYRREPELAFRQVVLRATDGAPPSAAQVGHWLARLRQAGPDADIDGLGAATMLPADQPPTPQSQVARAFGEDFAEHLMALPVGQWSGPVASSFGQHLVLVSERTNAAPARLEDVRPQVLREVLAERQQAAVQAMYDRLLERYRVTIETPAATAAPASAAPLAGTADGAVEPAGRRSGT